MVGIGFRDDWPWVVMISVVTGRFPVRNLSGDSLPAVLLPWTILIPSQVRPKLRFGRVGYYQGLPRQDEGEFRIM
jgi:hypothetical protein